MALLSLRRARNHDGTGRQQEIRELADYSGERLDRYRLFEDYYNGDQRTRLGDRARAYLEATDIKFSENIVETSVDKLARCFHVSGFEVDENDAAAAWLTRRVWGKQDELQGIVHTETPKLGDGFVIVSWDEATSRPRMAWNHPRLCKPFYDDDGNLTQLVKRWSTSRVGPCNPTGELVWRLNVYLPDRVEKWFSADKDGEVWAPWTDTAVEAWPLPWTVSGNPPPDEGEAEDPLGICAFHFRNRPKGRMFGRSEIAGMIPYQDEINKQVLDLFAVMDAQGWAWPWITGIGDSDNVTLAVGDIITIKSHEARVGQLPVTDPRPLIEAIDATLRRFSVKTDTPLFDLIKGTPPSGEALKTARSGQVAKVQDAQAGHGHTWEAAVSMAWRLASLYSGDEKVPEFDPGADITTVWRNPETRDEVAETQAGMFFQEIGVSNATLMRRFGFDPEVEAALKALEAPPPVPPPDSDA